MGDKGMSKRSALAFKAMKFYSKNPTWIDALCSQVKQSPQAVHVGAQALEDGAALAQHTVAATKLGRDNLHMAKWDGINTPEDGLLLLQPQGRVVGRVPGCVHKPVDNMNILHEIA
jgi:hypothetical protein